ncbi:hypothetical protein [Microbispora sp. H13382]|uniref:hypothetical protein n=1 Tax=Microbispora sp. H13382 TaxID=2729112 RepID=UPI00160148A2|nr:hypothetical protein [Microbispora sp. H13382]
MRGFQTDHRWARQFRAWGRSYRPIRSFTAYIGTRGPRCDGAASDPDNAFYCVPGHFIAYDVR